MGQEDLRIVNHVPVLFHQGIGHFNFAIHIQDPGTDRYATPRYPYLCTSTDIQITAIVKMSPIDDQGRPVPQINGRVGGIVDIVVDGDRAVDRAIDGLSANCSNGGRDSDRRL